MSTPKITLEYFNSTGRAEVARAAFWIGDIPFEDVRLTREQFGENKVAGKYPLGQVPVIAVNDGPFIPQSAAIVRYAAQLAGLTPSDPYNALLVDSYNETVNDLILLLATTFRIPDEECRTKREDIAQNALPKLFKYFESVIQDDKTFLVGDKLSTADLTLLIVIKGWISSGILDHIPATVIDQFPRFNAYIAKLEETAEIKKYRAAASKL